MPLPLNALTLRGFRGIACLLAVSVGLGGASVACGGIGINSNGADESAVDAGAFIVTTGPADASSADAGVTTSGDASTTAAPTASVAAASVCGDTTACAPDESTNNGCSGSATDEDGGALGGGTGNGIGTGNSGSGSGSTDGSAVGPACRVQASSATSATGATGSLVSMCSAAGSGKEGSACTAGADCASGFECIGTPGVCRRYCCAGTCSETSTFCDLQPIAGQDSIKVPACVPVSTCKLLMPNACVAGESCGVVGDNGVTSCITVGLANEGDSCESNHCAEDLVCLGQKGSRHCEKLCHVGGTDCSGKETCTGNAQVFTDSTIGVCQ